jgi:hypothetical protein
MTGIFAAFAALMTAYAESSEQNVKAPAAYRRFFASSNIDFMDINPIFILPPAFLF